ncbi:hypothetical protein GCM10022225_61310 [Plantactinospora mayteni]|uniref:Uncharacterized protein n=1 Tax=Plantactinospora mayteni TaxID=566021 RepID=A0ABQ4EZN6_9ACTN|nr:hypothetical protein Pma05_66990 [Plantactinospora mayteni]
MTGVATAVAARHPDVTDLACPAPASAPRRAPAEVRGDRHPTALLRVSHIYQSGFVRRSEHLPI